MIKTIKIDKSKWDACYRKRGITQQSISYGIGKGKSYISSWTKRNKMPVEAVCEIERKYGIKPDEYTPTKYNDENNICFVDRYKLNAELNKIGKNLSKASLEMNRSSSYLSQQITKNKFNMNLVNLLFKMYGIEFDNYKLKDETDRKGGETGIAIDYIKLSKIVTDATYVGIINAYTTIKDDLKDEIDKSSYRGARHLFVESGLIDEYLKEE